MWFSLDAKAWFGGVTSLNGVANPRSIKVTSLFVATASIPLNKHQRLKIAHNNRDYVQFGGNYHNVSLAWQYSWFGRPNSHYMLHGSKDCRDGGL